MKPLSLGTWAQKGSWRERLAWCARAAFRRIEVRDEGAQLALKREDLRAHGLELTVFEENAGLPFDAAAYARAASLGAAYFLHAPRKTDLRERAEAAARHGLRSLCRASALASAEVGYLWDTWEAHRLGLDAAHFAPRIEHVRFADGITSERTALGAGEVDLRAQYAALRDILARLPCWGLDFEGCAHPAREAQKAAGFLRELSRSREDR